MQHHRIEPGTRVDLGTLDPSDTSALPEGKQGAKAELERLVVRLAERQELLFADGRHKLLVVLQAIDAGGKDGTIRHVFSRMNPQGVKVRSFRSPTDEELSRDFLWRVHEAVPGHGEIGVFNRSHYEDVLIVRVHELVQQDRWRRRYGHIRDFERMLFDEGTTIVKFFLHIDREEQRKRLQSRLDDPTKRWKFEPGDLEQRQHWDAYRAAFNDALSETSIEEAPWYVIPANHKWYRNVAVARILLETLDGLDLRYPQPPDLADVVVT